MILKRVLVNYGKYGRNEGLGVSVMDFDAIGFDADISKEGVKICRGCKWFMWCPLHGQEYCYRFVVANILEKG